MSKKTFSFWIITFPKRRSSSSEVFYNIGLLQNFTKFTGKHLCQNLLLKNVLPWRPATLLRLNLQQ